MERLRSINDTKESLELKVNTSEEKETYKKWITKLSEEQVNEKLKSEPEKKILTLVIDGVEHKIEVNYFLPLHLILKQEVLFSCGIIQDLITNLYRNSSYSADTPLLKRFYAFSPALKRIPSSACSKCLVLYNDRIILSTEKTVEKQRNNKKNPKR
ncbi:hypothetical protein RB653_006512 [Dictyostelium firmibasis]|uniref:Uncharacterized protein n=1 Tax=Dictyostelium firmibasis TaxID=79012 RepID=A0AAN7U2V0_9MYCE